MNAAAFIFLLILIAFEVWFLIYTDQINRESDGRREEAHNHADDAESCLAECRAIEKRIQALHDCIRGITPTVQ